MLGGCIEPAPSHDGAMGQNVLVLEPHEDARSTEYRGTRIIQGLEHLLIAFDVKPPAGADSSRFSCSALVENDLHHRVYLDAEPGPLEILERTDDEVILTVAYNRIEVLTWFDSFEIECSVELPGEGRLHSEMGTFIWTAQPQLGDPRFAFGMGPNFTDDVFLNGKPCNVTVHDLRDDDTEVICFPPNQIEGVSVWENETSMFLKAQFEEEPLTSAVLTWYYFGELHGPAREAVSYTYSFSTNEASKDHQGRLDHDWTDQELTLMIPFELLEDRRDPDNIEFRVNIIADDGPKTYLFGMNVPPYWLTHRT